MLLSNSPSVQVLHRQIWEGGGGVKAFADNADTGGVEVPKLVNS